MMLAQVLCLTAALYKEARSEPAAAQLAVAHVVMARKAETKTSVCHVIAKKNQFSWVKNGKVAMPKASASVDKKALKRAFDLSRRVLFEQLRSNKLNNKYQFFNTKELGKLHHTNNNPVVIGKLIFY